MPDDVQFSFQSASDSPGFLLWQMTNQWQRAVRAALEPLDLTHTQFVLLAGLAWLSRSDEPVSQIQVAQHSSIDVMMASEVLRTLERKGLVIRAPHPHDTRAKALHLTAEGTARVNQAVQIVEQVDREFFATLGDELPHFVALMNQVLKS